VSGRTDERADGTSDTTSTNQAVRARVTLRRIPLRRWVRLGWAGKDVGCHDTVLFVVTCILQVYCDRSMITCILQVARPCEAMES